MLIPVGPGHRELCEEAAGSTQTAAAYSRGPFETVTVRLHDDTDGKHGRSRMRNRAVQQSTADWVFFLDADDLMHPAAFRNLPAHIGYAETAPVAVWGTIVEYRDGCYAERYQVPDIDSYAQLIQYAPFHSIQMGHFVQRDIAAKYPFDEMINCGEDWDYYLRIWQNERCEKIAKPLMLNRRGQHSTGPKSATGQDWTAAVGKMLHSARLEQSSAAIPV